MKISTQAKLISTALVAFAIGAPIAHGQTDGALLSKAGQNNAQIGSGSYPRLKSGEGFSFTAPNYWSTTQTTHVRMNRSLEVPPQYLSPETLTQLKAPSEAINRSLGVPPQYQLPSEQISSATASSGFDWGDAGIGAAFVAGLGMLGAGGLLAVRRRHAIA